MKGIETLIRDNPPIMRPGDYINPDDGLLYCGRCNTKKEHRFTLLGETRIVSCLCRCESERLKEREEEAEKTQRMKEIENMKAAGLQDRTLKTYTFDNDNGRNPLMCKARKYVDDWDEVYRDNLGLIMLGGVGTGKSFFAGCIANALISKGVPVLMTSMTKILNSMCGSFDVDKNAYIASLNNYQLLIIDDLGVERNTEYALEMVFGVIDGRYRSRKPLIITTNLTWKALSHKEGLDMMHQRIYSRVLEICQPVFFSDLDLREENASNKREKLSKILSG